MAIYERFHLLCHLLLQMCTPLPTTPIFQALTSRTSSLFQIHSLLSSFNVPGAHLALFLLLSTHHCHHPPLSPPTHHHHHYPSYNILSADDENVTYANGVVSEMIALGHHAKLEFMPRKKVMKRLGVILINEENKRRLDAKEAVMDKSEWNLFVKNWKKENAVALEKECGLADGPQSRFLTGIMFAPSTSSHTVPLLQKVVQADASHMLIGKYTLFSAYSGTANMNMSPVAFAIFFGNEDTESWTKFLEFAAQVSADMHCILALSTCISFIPHGNSALIVTPMHLFITNSALIVTPMHLFITDSSKSKLARSHHCDWSEQGIYCCSEGSTSGCIPFPLLVAPPSEHHQIFWKQRRFNPTQCELDVQPAIKLQHSTVHPGQVGIIFPTDECQRKCLSPGAQR